MSAPANGRPSRFRVLGLNPGQTPRFEVDYADGSTLVIDDTWGPEAESTLAAVIGPALDQ